MLRLRLLGCLCAMLLVCWLLGLRAADDDGFVLLSVECRTAFDSAPTAPGQGVGRAVPAWTGDTLVASLSAWERRAGTRVWVLYRVCVPEDAVAGEMTAVRSSPRRLDFPVEESALRDVPVYVLRETDEQAEVQVANINLKVNPGEEVRVGVIVDSMGRWNAFTDPEEWAESLGGALSEGRTVGVWVIQNLGTVTYASVVDTEEGGS